jgi:hypothetical protein
MKNFKQCMNIISIDQHIPGFVCFNHFIHSYQYLQSLLSTTQGPKVWWFALVGFRIDTQVQNMLLMALGLPKIEIRQTA